MTATEVHVRVQMIRQLLGPVYGRLQAEYLRPLVERCFGLCFRAGILGEPPQSLAGRDFSVRYVSPLARAQRLEEVTAVERLYQNVGALAQAKGDTAIFDRIDEHAALEVVADGLGVPGKLLRSQDDVQKIRQQKAEAAEQQQAQASAMQTQQVAAEAAAKKQAVA